MDVPTARQSALVARLATPRWYHPAGGGALALLVASPASGSAAVVVAALLGYLVALYALPRAFRRSTGIWYTGETPPLALREARRLGWTHAGSVLLASVLVSAGVALLALVVAVAAYVLVQVYGGRFDAALRAELLQDPELPFKVEDRDEDA